MAAKAPVEKKAPTFGAVEPPRRTRKGGFEISADAVDALAGALENAEDGAWVGDGLTYTTMGRAQAASQRYRRALTDAKRIGDAKEVASRVWQDGDSYRVALRMRGEGEVSSE